MQKGRLSNNTHHRPVQMWHVMWAKYALANRSACENVKCVVINYCLVERCTQPHWQSELPHQVPLSYNNTVQ